MAQGNNTEPVTFGAFTVDVAEGEVCKHGVRLKLGGQPLEILRMLLERPGAVVTREELRAALWAGDTFVDFDHSLNAAVNKLREALGDSAENPRYVETLPRRGYRFIGQINGHSASPSAVADGAVPAAQPRRWGVAALLAAAGLIAAAVGLDVGGLRGRWFGAGAPAVVAVQSVAVLPFANLSNDPEQEYFADGMTEELISQLAQVKALRVISRTSAMRYKQTQKPLPEIGRELNVQAVVEGSVLRAGERVRISAQLVDVATDQHLWAQTFERELADVIGLQREVARAISEQIRVQVTPQERARLTSAGAVNPQAYQEYLLGRYYQHKAVGWANVRAIEHYRKSIAIDEGYAPALVGLAHTLVFARTPRVSMPEAKQLAERALELAPESAEAHVVMGVVRATWEWDWAGAEESYQRALSLDANNAYAHHSYSILLAALGRFEEALAEAKRALELDPLAGSFGHTLGRIYYFARQYDEAQRQYLETLKRDPTDVWSHFFLAIVSEEKGDLEAAAKYRLRTATLTPGFGPELIPRLQKIQEREGYRGLLRENIRLEMQLFPKDDLISSAVALMYCRLGEKEKALEWLEYAFQSHTRDMVFTNVQPQYDLIRNEPRFQALLAKMKFPPKQ